MRREATLTTAERSPDEEDRIRDFLARHGGPDGPLSDSSSADGMSGHWEIGAADGYTLRCRWSRTGSRHEMEYSEIPPHATAGETT